MARRIFEFNERGIRIKLNNRCEVQVGLCFAKCKRSLRVTRTRLVLTAPRKFLTHAVDHHAEQDHKQVPACSVNGT